ncbi:MAG: hypothetical protein AAF492_18585, partial [Verrucomicrobiota bacterium]
LIGTMSGAWTLPLPPEVQMSDIHLSEGASDIVFKDQQLQLACPKPELESRMVKGLIETPDGPKMLAQSIFYGIPARADYQTVQGLPRDTWRLDDDDGSVQAYGGRSGTHLWSSSTRSFERITLGKDQRLKDQAIGPTHFGFLLDRAVRFVNRKKVSDSRMIEIETGEQLVQFGSHFLILSATRYAMARNTGNGFEVERFEKIRWPEDPPSSIKVIRPLHASCRTRETYLLGDGKVFTMRLKSDRPDITKLRISRAPGKFTSGIQILNHQLALTVPESGDILHLVDTRSGRLTEQQGAKSWFGGPLHRAGNRINVYRGFYVTAQQSPADNMVTVYLIHPTSFNSKKVCSFQSSVVPNSIATHGDTLQLHMYRYALELDLKILL